MTANCHKILPLLALALYLQLLVSPSHSQQTGAYPPVDSVATYRPVTADSVCGANGPEQYCQYTTDTAASPSLGLLPSCIMATCDNTCPHATTSPSGFNLAAAGTLGAGVTQVQGREGVEVTAFRFQSSSIEVAANNVPGLGENGFTFVAWINRDSSSNSRGTLVSKSTPDSDSIERNYVISVEEDRVTFDYLPDTIDLSNLPDGSQRYRTVIIDGVSVVAGVWHHIAVTVYAEDAAVYVNGIVEGVQALEGKMVDTNRTLLLGETSDGIGSYSGLMEDMYLYTQALTQREVQELFEGSLPFSYLSTDCHCPPSHPVINLDDETQCIQHSGGSLINRGASDRINPLAHPPGFINDLNVADGNGWITSPGGRQANITLNLTNSLYELIFMNFRFGSPRFKAAILETSRDGGVTFEPIQYFADDCMVYFGLQNNGAITDGDSVNCITSQSLQTPTYGADVRTRLLDPQTRPFNLNNNPELREFILSSHLRLQLVDLFTDDTTDQHQYYNILEITVAARCACNGHSSRCGSSIDSVCECAHNTEGDTCNRCLPLYNDKPWRYGETDNAYPCKLCDCNGHATSCHYNATLDPFPDSYDQGGGGVCENCQSNTAGQHCENCAFTYYRTSGVSADDPNPCMPCNCDTRGDTNNGDCVKSEGIPGQIVGQCQCKSNVMGLQCDQCRDGFFALSATNPQGCSPCNCNTDGTVLAIDTCHATSGQCQCKENVMGLKCDQCINVTTGLTALNEDGCSPCDCNVNGSLSSVCHTSTGACQCKPGIGGVRCDECLDGYFDFSEDGCKPCTCHLNGSVSNVCDKASGVCTCAPNVEADLCDTCFSGFYNISAGCIECGCYTNGTINGTISCDEDSGQCSCKDNVEGRTCDTCQRGYTALTAANDAGCEMCNCSEFGTDQSGFICDPVSSQCECLPTATGYRCDDCVTGFYSTAEGCMECDCDPNGSSSGMCEVETGDCPCNEGVGGERCDFCLSGFFQFPSCEACDCDSSGTVDGAECDVITGVCNCKMFVTGDTCNMCLPGYQLLDNANPFGCSAAPDEQGPPTASLLGSTFIELTWQDPEAPNGVIIGYRLYRNGSNIANITERSYNDTALIPNTYYSYAVESFNVIGSTTSIQVAFITLEGIPTGLSAPMYKVLNSTAVVVSWAEPTISHGTISTYVLVMETDSGNLEVFEGDTFTYTVTNLRPYTIYSFFIQACTTGGCGSSNSSQVETAQAVPTFQPAPTVTPLSDTELNIEWNAPSEPNGILLEYRVFQRGAPYEGDGMLVTTVDADTLMLIIADLEPFTSYEFRVESYTEPGGTSSDWSEGRTQEAAPSGVAPPTVTATTSSSLEVTWTEPATPNGVIISYSLYNTTSGGDLDTLLTNSFSPDSFVVTGLESYTEYGFIVEVCTSAGCTLSEEGRGFTGESVPTGQPEPTLTNITATSVHLSWEAPSQPNGNISSYFVHRRTPSLLPTPARNDVGVSFTGTGYATFTPSNPSRFDNELVLQFRTLDCCGIIFYSINTAKTDMFAIELRDGIPWLIFDAGSGPGAVRPEGNTTFNDGAWHRLRVTQVGSAGTITVDNMYTGSGQLLGSNTVIAYVVHYVGGLPSDADLQTLNGNLNSEAVLSGQTFAGCLYNVAFNDIIFDFSTGFPGVGRPDNGCPVDLVTTVQLLGGGYFSLAEDTITGNSFNTSFQFRTTHSDGLLLFVSSSTGDVMYGIELHNSNLHLVMNDISTILTTVDPPCNREWHSITISQTEDSLSLTLDDILQQSFTFTDTTTSFFRIFFGGVPYNSIASALALDVGLNTDTPFSGCIRFSEHFFYLAGQPITPTIAESELVNFDGCGTAPGTSCISAWVEIDAGTDRSITDTFLTPFSAYLYRVVAMNTAGRAFSSWQATNTEQSAPAEVGIVTLLTATSTSLSLTWSPPETQNGLITQYSIQTTPETQVDGHTGATFTLLITEPEQRLEATLNDLIPFTNYSVTLSASTVIGTRNGQTIILTTTEAAPEGVQPAYVTKFGSRSLVLSWGRPTQPNGIITQYRLYIDNILQFSGLATTTTVNNLLPSTVYTFMIEACTSVGCSNSSETSNTTLPDKPDGLSPPSVIPLTPTSLEVTWKEPAIPNGEIIDYELQQITVNRNITLFQGISLSHQVTDLIPNTVYRFRVLATNAGGTTASDIAENRTLEDAPDGLTPPVTTVINATAISVSWLEPLQPNGVISEYILSRNSSEVFRGLDLIYLDSNLEPFTYYSYYIQACTSGNCSASTPSIVRTDEAVPEGILPLTISFVTSNTLTLTVNEVLKPNGIVVYVVMVTGMFDGSSLEETREVFNDTEVGTVVVMNLLPFSDYEITQTVSNNAGSLVGDVEIITTDPTAPEGLAPPSLTLINATTVDISWSAPDHPNDDITRYELTITNNTDTSLIIDQGLNTSTVISNLRPFTNYSVCVTVYNSVGNTSAVDVIQTGETAPTGFDEVIVEMIGPRFILLSWDEPAQPNGVLIVYTLLEGGDEIADIVPPAVEYNVTGLTPYTQYMFSVMACTSAGCEESPAVETRTLEDVPEGVQPPIVSNAVSGQVFVRWEEPTQPNGIILYYILERAQNEDEEFIQLDNITAGELLLFGDLTVDPYTEYRYRIVAVNSAGSATGPESSILTPEAAPENVLTPTLIALSSSTIQVIFQPPLTPNGILTSYSLTRTTSSLSPSTTLNLNISALPRLNGSYIYDDALLSPFTNYAYYLTVCTDAGCSDSDTVWIVTNEAAPTELEAPSVTTLNESSILVMWEPPLQPNGEIERYTILQRSLGFLTGEDFVLLSNCCEDYLNFNETVIDDSCNRVMSVDETTQSYIVTALEAYSNYQYCIIATNSAGSTFSPISNITRTFAATMPTTGPTLTATTLNSTAIYLYWSMLNISQLLGPFGGYSLFVREAGQDPPGQELFTGVDQEFTATELLASTAYTFLVLVSNGRGSAFSNNASAVTEEGIPANLSAPQVQALSATSIYVSWRAPNEPNGNIISYTIFLNSVEYYNQSMPGNLMIESLSPFTPYTIRVEACTQFGCTLSPQVTEYTLESAPVGLASPTVQITGATSTNISWVEPLEANGIITQYQLFQREGGLNGEPNLVLSALTFAYTATELHPFTMYGYEVYAINGGGNVSSGVTVGITDEARPTSFDAPTVTVMSATVIQLSWVKPEEINGVFLGYNIYRNDTELLNEVMFTEYTDSNLEPFTQYSYIIEACTNAGCTASATVSNRTLEAAPEMVSMPYFLDVQSRSLTITWEEPEQPNGIVTQYILSQIIDSENSTVLSADLTQSYSLTDLTPFTTYSFYVDTCNSAGCTRSITVSVTTLQAPPEGVDPPLLRDLTSTSAHIEWSTPSFSNGIITNYTVHRGTENTNPVIVFEGLAFFYDDMDLIANTLYSYTVTATNDGGSTESAPSYIQTIPDLPIGILPPSVEVLSPTSIRVTWTPPESPNGDISLYILYMDDVAVFSGIGFEYSRSDLTPYTEYTFYYQVRNQAGSAASLTTTARTDPSLPEGLAPPRLEVLGSSAIRVEWQPPSAPNGDISEYRVRRRLFDNPPTEFLHFVTEDTTVLSFQNSGLEPFTRYEYRVEVFNQVGSTLSSFSDETTSEDLPEGVIAPSISSSNTFARNLTATWSPPLEPNGVITGYRLEYRLLLDPTTSLPGEIIIAAQTPASVTSATAINLTPVTTYEFRVAAFNGAGDGFSEWEVITTAEDVPEGITEIVVESRTSFSLTLSWGLPDRPNGAIREYILLLDGEIEHQTQLTTYQVTRLEPFTTYSLQLGACTSAGCTYGSTQFAGTEEAPPTGQAAPTVMAQSPRRVQITWQSPSQVNGIIIIYEVLRHREDTTPIIVFSTTDTVTREFVDTTVQPATTYGYAIAANNSAGGVISEYRTLTTPEAAPEGLTIPTVRVTSSVSIEVSWSPPLQPNGIISQYQVFRDGEGRLNESVYIGQNRQFTDTDLAPFTMYTYTLQACTSGGCAFSGSVSNTTFEALPQGFDGNSIEASPLTSASIRVAWTQPLFPNGIIVHYEVIVSDGTSSIEIVISDLITDVTNLLPYIEYTVTVNACNSIGCITGTTSVTTLESVPQFVAPPTLQALSPTIVSIQWQQPAQPNGVIISYIVRRDGLAIFEGNSLNYNDTGLDPNRGYSYTVQAFTAVGGSEQSASASIETPPDTPEDISPPTTTALGADSILVEWEVPGQPNGVIKRYILSVNGSIVFEGPSIFEFTVDGLAPFTVYQFQLDVCTTTCGNSSSITERTGEAPPIGQTPPTLAAPFQNTTVLVTWEPPTQPNGIIINYELRRGLESTGTYNLIYSGLDVQFRDSGMDLQPAMVYEYQITSTNSVDSVTSESRSIKLPDAAPVGIQRPTISDITSASLIVTATPPNTPNGLLTSYILYENDSNILAQVPTDQDSTINFTVNGLQPYTVYVYRIEICTSGGCGSSDEVTVITADDVPQSYDTLPVGVVISARSILVTWSLPRQPNGVIISYTLWYRLACPQPEQPEFTSSTQCFEGPLIRVTSTDQTQFTLTGSTVTDLFPYSRYQFLVEAQNSVGAVNSTISLAVETHTSIPEVKDSLEFVANQNTGIINLNWVSAFRPNGPIQRYTLTRNGIALLSRPTTSVVLSNEPRDTDLTYVVTIQTSVGEASTDPVTLRLQQVSTTPSDSTTDANDGSSDEGSPFYKEAAFITGMVILGACLLFIAGAVFLCFVRPLGDPGFPASPHSISTHLNDTPTKLNVLPMNRLDTSTKQSHNVADLTRHSRGTMAGSWTPGDPIWEDLPDMGEEDGLLVTPRKHRSYSPRREEKARLLEEEVLPDTHIAGYGSDSMGRGGTHYTTSAREDFGTFRASQTTFADTKV